jgi:peptide/nickel transport system permease protein
MTDQHPRLRELKFTLHRIFRNPAAIIGFSLVLFFAAVAIFAPQIAPPKYDHNPYLMPHKGFSSETHIFGTASGQYDIFYGVVWGTRTAFKIGLFVVGIAALIGVTLGAISGYYGGIVDEVLMRIVDVMWAIPTLVLAMTIVVAFGRGLDKIMIALALVGWRWYVRVIRSEILTLRDQDFVQAAKIMGVSDVKIILRHIIPNAIYPVLIMATMDVGSMVIGGAQGVCRLGPDGGPGQKLYCRSAGRSPQVLVCDCLSRWLYRPFRSGVEPDRRCPARCLRPEIETKMIRMRNANFGIFDFL